MKKLLFINIFFALFIFSSNLFSQEEYFSLSFYNKYSPDQDNLNELCVSCNKSFTFEFKTYMLNPGPIEESLSANSFHCYYLTVKLYKMVNTQTGEYQFYDSIKYEVEPSWYMMYADLTLQDKGFYKFIVYHEDGRELKNSLLIIE